MTYPHTCTITRESAAGTTTVYSGPCVLYDGRTSTERARAGDVVIGGVPTINVPSRTLILDPDRDRVSVTANGAVQTARVVAVEYVGPARIIELDWMGTAVAA